MRHLSGRRTGQVVPEWDEPLSCGCCTGPGLHAIWRKRAAMTPEDVTECEDALVGRFGQDEREVPA